MCDLTILAFELAFRYRNPAIVLADAVLGQMMETIRLPEAECPRPDTDAWAVDGRAETRGNLITSIFLDANTLARHNERLQAKYAAMQAEVRWECDRTDDAELVLVAYGASSRLARTAIDELRASGVRAGLFRPLTLYPFPVQALCKTVAGRRLMVVEMSNGQFRDDISFHLGAATGRVPAIGLVSRIGGLLIGVDEIAAGAREFLRAAAPPP
jgi:2-oxoisovalerate ferredoxin oxidoreductase alpha subunit